MARNLALFRYIAPGDRECICLWAKHDGRASDATVVKRNIEFLLFGIRKMSDQQLSALQLGLQRLRRDILLKVSGYPAPARRMVGQF